MAGPDISWAHYKVNYGSATHQTLSEMEAGAAWFLYNMNPVMENKQVRPYRLMRENRLFALTLIPEGFAGYPAELLAEAVRYYIRGHFQQVAISIASHKHRSVHYYNQPINIYDKVYETSKQQPLADAMIDMAISALDSMNPDLNVALALDNNYSSSDPNSALVVVDKRTFTPNLMRHSENWIICVPGNPGETGYVPPESTPLSRSDFESLYHAIPKGKRISQQNKARRLLSTLPKLSV